MGLARVLIEENWCDRDFITSFTDLPLLVRLDNGKRLRAEEVEGLDVPSGIPPYREAFVAYNGHLVVVHPERLDLPADVILDGQIEVRLKNGSRTKAKPVFSLLRDKLRTYTPAYVEGETGVRREVLVRLAREMATTRPLHVIYGASAYQWYHGDLKGRALALLPVLTGNLGQPGAGISTYAGQYRIRFDIKSWWFPQSPKWVPWLYFLHGPTREMAAKYPAQGIKGLIFG